MDRLSIILSLLSGSLITGTLVITAFSMGYYTWWVIGAAAVIGFVLAWPSAYYVSRMIKNRDTEWPTRDNPMRDGAIPRRNAEEV